MDQPRRKQIRLRDYDYAQNNAYFVTICTHNRARLFEAGSEPGRMAEKWLLEMEKKFGNINIEKYIVMPDHVHLILTITGDHTGSPLQDMIRWFKTMTTNEYIRSVKSGLYPPFDRHVWQRNYYEHILRSEQEMLEAWKYIDNNRYERDNCRGGPIWSLDNAFTNIKGDQSAQNGYIGSPLQKI